MTDGLGVLIGRHSWATCAAVPLLGWCVLLCALHVILSAAKNPLLRAELSFRACLPKLWFSGSDCRHLYLA